MPKRSVIDELVNEIIASGMDAGTIFAQVDGPGLTCDAPGLTPGETLRGLWLSQKFDISQIDELDARWQLEEQIINLKKDAADQASQMEE